MDKADEIARRFNEEVLKRQLNPNGESLQKLAEMIREALELEWQRGIEACEWNHSQ